MGELFVMRTAEISDLLHFSSSDDAKRYARDLVERKENPSQRAVVAIWGKQWNLETKQLQYVSAVIQIEDTVASSVTVAVIVGFDIMTSSLK